MHHVVSFEYDAANSFNVPLRTRARCEIDLEGEYTKKYFYDLKVEYY